MGNIIRKVIAILLCATALILMFLPVNGANAATSQHGDYIFDGSTLKEYVGSDSQVSLPNTISKIGKDAFSNNSNLTKVTIPDSVKEIDYAAFENCVNLQKVSMPSSVRTIGSSAFSGCESLSSINFEDKVNSIGSGIFAGCTSLSDVSISSDNLYFTCIDGVIYSKDGSILYMYLPGRCKSTFDMPLSVNEIGEYSFWGSDKLTSVVVSNGVASIPEYAFSNCKALNNVKLPQSVTSIERFAFSDCDNLQFVDIPDSVGSIDPKSFVKSDGTIVRFVSGSGNVIKEVTPKEAIASTGGDVSKMEDETDKNTVDNTTDSSIDSNEADTSNEINSDNQQIANKDSGYNASYSGNPKWKNNIENRDFSENKKKNELGSGVIVGGNVMLMMNPDMPVIGFDIDEAETEDSVEESGLESSRSTTTVNDVHNIINGKYVAYNGNDADITLPAEVNSIGSRAFYENSIIGNVNLPENVDNIGQFAFARSSLSSVNIPDGVKKIDYAAFYHCVNLSDVSIPQSVETIELGAFEGTKWLYDYMNTADNNNYLVVGDGILLAYKGEGGNVSIPDTVKKIGPACFKGNSTITKIDIPAGCKVIGEDAFNSCINLKEVTLHEGLQSIEDRAFANTQIDYITIPDSVEDIGLAAFDMSDNYSSLKTAIILGKDVPNISHKDTATRLSTKNLWADALGDCENVLVTNDCDINSGNLLDPLNYGFHGQVYSVYNSADNTLSLRKCTKRATKDGNIVINSNIGIGNNEYIITAVSDDAFNNLINWQDYSDYKPRNIKINGNASEDLSRLISGIMLKVSQDEPEERTGVSVILTGDEFSFGEATALIPGDSDKYTLKVTANNSLEEVFKNAFYNAYGNLPENPMMTYDMDLFDSTGTIPIHKLGNNKMDVTLPLPVQYRGYDTLEILGISENGSLEEINAAVGGEKNNKVEFVASHFSAYAFYIKDEKVDTTSDFNAITSVIDSLQPDYIKQMQPVETTITTDDSLYGYDDTGFMGTVERNVSRNLGARWYVILILFSLGGILFFYKPHKLKQ